MYLYRFIGSVSLILMMLIGFANVASRCFWRPIKGSFEVVGFLGATVVGENLQLSH